MQEKRKPRNAKLKRAELSVQKFIKETGLQPGKDRISTSVIYRRYRMEWDDQIPKATLVQFFREFKKQFKPYRGRSIRGYEVDNSQGVFNNSTENRIKSKLYVRNYVNNRRQERKERKKAQGETVHAI